MFAVKKNFLLIEESSAEVMRGTNIESEERPSCTIPEVVGYIENLKNVRALGILLKIKPGRLDEIENSRTQIVQEWFKVYPMDDADRWEELGRVLLEPAVNEPTIASRLRLHLRRGSSVDSAISDMLSERSDSISSPTLLSPHHEVSYIESIGKKTEECSIPNVLNCIEPYGWYEIGLCLNLPENKLDQIKESPLSDQKTHFVELWHRLDPIYFTWTRLKQALLQTRGRMGSSTSIDCGLPSKHSRDAITIRTEINSLHRKFFSLIKDFREQLNSQKKDIADVHDTLLYLPQNLNAIYSPILEEMFHSLEKCESFRKFFFKLNDCWNFIDYDLLESVIEEHGNAALKSAMNTYLKELSKFCQSTTVHQLIKIWQPNYPNFYSPHSQQEDRKLFVSRLNRDAKMYTIQELDHFRREAFHFARPLSTAALILYDIMPGSVTILWLVAEKDIDEFSSSISVLVKTSQFIHQHGILFLCLDDCILYPVEEYFWNACREGRVQHVRELLDANNADPNYFCEALGMSVLMCAAKHGLSEICALLVEFGATVDAENENGTTALLLAVQNGHMMKALLHDGANLFHSDKNGDTVLSLSKSYDRLHEKLRILCEIEMIKAAKKNDLPLLERAWEIGVDPNAKEKDDYGWTALLWACDNSHVGAVDYLLEHGADVNAQDSEEWTGLILSSRRGNLDIVRKLLDKGADIHKLSNVRWGALMWAAEEGHAHVVKFLLERGAKAEVKDKLGFTPLLQASQDGHLGVVKVLVEHDPDIDMDQTANSGWSAVMMATKNGHEDVVRYLVDHGSDVYYQKEDEVTALHIAGYKGHNSIVRYFCLSKKLKVNTQDKDGITPLMFAVKERQLEVVRTLVENGRADVNIRESANSWTALFFAVEAREPKVLEYLLRSERVDVTHMDDIGNSIVDLAKHINPPALDLLSKHHKKETEIMAEKSSATPRLFTMIPYQKMLNRMNIAVSGQKEVAVFS